MPPPAARVWAYGKFVHPAFSGEVEVMLRPVATVIDTFLTVRDKGVPVVESVTTKVGVIVPVEPVAVPEITPAVVIVRPAGSPLTVQLYGVVPPAATMLGLYPKFV